jgi:ketosteroid isomerase-like protein
MNGLAWVFMVVTLISCQTQQAVPNEAELKAIVRKQNEKLKSLFMTGDADKISQLYTENAKLSADGNNDIVRGREAIRDFWKSGMQGVKVVDMTSETLSIDTSGDVIYETGKVTNRLEIKDSVFTFKAKYVNVWKKEDGEYKLDVDSWIDIQESNQ